MMCFSEVIDHMFGMMRNTAPFNLTGHPAISVNAGQGPDAYSRRNEGCMIVGKKFHDSTVLKVAYALEQELIKCNYNTDEYYGQK